MSEEELESQTILDRLIALSLAHRGRVAALVALLLVSSGVVLSRENIDVLPNLNRPVVNIVIEAHGLAPEEIEKLITIPTEAALRGAAGVTKVRSISKRGVVLVTAEFDWGSDIYRNRQIVSEKLSTLSGQIPTRAEAHIGPISSIMGEIQLIGLYSQSGATPIKEIRSFADWTLRKQLQSISGVSNVTVLGGEVKEYQIIIDPALLAKYDIRFDDALDNLQGIGLNTTGGFLQKDGQEYVIRNIGELYNHAELGDAAIGYFAGLPVTVSQVARVEVGHKPRRGDAGIDGHNGIVLAVQKQPNASTLELTEKINAQVERLRIHLPKGVTVVPDLFRQSEFIERSLENVFEAIRDGALIVVFILFLFLWNLRTTVITLLAIPLSLLAAILILAAFDYSINTMTLGGFAIAIGLLVDDAIVDVENIFRRLKEQATAGLTGSGGLQSHPDKDKVIDVIFKASSEVRNSIVLATIIVVIVFLPLLFLTGVEGRLFRPLALSFIISLIASLFVALVVTPVLAFYLLPAAASLKSGDSFLVARLKQFQAQNLTKILNRPLIPVSIFTVLFSGSVVAVPFLGTEFLPAFNEGTLTLEVINPAGLSLEASIAKAKEVEKICLATEGVKRVSRRTGRSELDEHAEGVHYSEFDVGLDLLVRPKSETVAELRAKTGQLTGVAVNFGQPISHRLDHLLSGIKAEVAVFIYGPGLEKLLRYAYQTEKLIKDIPGASDILTETQSYGPELKVALIPGKAAAFGISTAQLSRTLEHALNGVVVGQNIEGERIVDMRMIVKEDTRSDKAAMGAMVLKYLPNGAPVLLRDVADIFETKGPYEIKRDGGRRRIAVQFNVAGRDSAEVVAETYGSITKHLKLEPAYSVEMGGRHKTREETTILLGAMGMVGILLILLLLYYYFHSWLLAFQILLNIPFGLVGAVAFMYLFDIKLSLASIVGLISLAGIASRNGILMIAHYLHLMRIDGLSFSAQTVIRGSGERLVPVLMTAFTAILALLPIILTGDEASGKEILYPVAVVISGGLLSSTLLDIFLTPVVFYWAGQRTNLLAKVGIEQ